MTDPDETLSAIDAAIEGWNGYDGTVSDDAMRWAPEPPEPPERRRRGAEPTLMIRDEMHHHAALDSNQISRAQLGRIYIAPLGTAATNATPDGEWTATDWATDGSLSLDSDRLLDGAARDHMPVWSGARGSWSQAATVTLTPSQERALRTWAQEWTEQVRRQHAGITRAFRRLHRNLLETAEKAHAGFAPLTYGDAYGKHRRRCRSCNPAGNPKPLNVNGADYARRRKNRRRRRG